MQAQRQGTWSDLTVPFRRTRVRLRMIRAQQGICWATPPLTPQPPAAARSRSSSGGGCCKQAVGKWGSCFAAPHTPEQDEARLPVSGLFGVMQCFHKVANMSALLYWRQPGIAAAATRPDRQPQQHRQRHARREQAGREKLSGSKVKDPPLQRWCLCGLMDKASPSYDPHGSQEKHPGSSPGMGQLFLAYLFLSFVL